jgi:uncharacterized tellurite resistance protein B-like protein
MLDPVSASGKALEDAFFAERDRVKLARFKADLARQAQLAELAAASGVGDDDVLAQLHDLDIGADTFVALALVPLVEVAWADGTLDEKERAAVRKAAAEEGVHEGEPAHALLDGWLAERPGPELHAAWYEYVRALLDRLSPEAAAKLQEGLLGRARRVAEAAGGFLGLMSRVSPSEQQVLDDLRAAFARS